ncbi:hypothetical protein ILUMI_06200 [Ignelater luminosus]|uniref:HTH psq-type domain-containing protein n=1 Tax=Ignelater luminosus TaxID=2038154 RepID=A0A8K0DAG6_IGNLU|nr:hypothetical protein ILUMI_06200 [Ignelater luminosus]
MVKAICAVSKKKMGTLKAAKTFNVPCSTLRDLSKKDKLPLSYVVSTNFGRKSLLEEQMKKELVAYLLQMEEKLYGFTLKELRRMAFQLVSRNRFKQGEADRAWKNRNFPYKEKCVHIALLHESGKSCSSWSKPQKENQEESSNDLPANLAELSSNLISALRELQSSFSKAVSFPQES